MMWHQEAAAPVLRLSLAHGKRSGLGRCHAVEGAPCPWKLSPLVNVCLVSFFFVGLLFFFVCWVLFLFLLFCFPFTGSDVALAPVVTCFITSSFNNVSTDLNWSF